MKQIKGYKGYYIDESGSVYSNRKGSYKPLKAIEGRVRLVNPDDSSKRKIVRVSRLYMQAYNKLLPKSGEIREVTTMNRIPPNNDPFYPDAYHEADHTPEGFCPTCESYTENYDHHGCCRECGTEVKENANL